MKYLCLIQLDERKLDALSGSELEALNAASLDYDETLRKSGHFVAAQALESVRVAATVRVQNGKVLVTDGPFAESREQVGGFILIEAEDREEAIQLASKLPVAELAAVEIRPIKELKRPLP